MIAIVTNFKKKIESISILEKNRNTQNPKKYKTIFGLNLITILLNE